MCGISLHVTTKNISFVLKWESLKDIEYATCPGPEVMFEWLPKSMWFRLNMLQNDSINYRCFTFLERNYVKRAFDEKKR